jgi:predicted choloylglycine hydrolase
MSGVLQKRFRIIEEEHPGEKWLDFYRETQLSYREWFKKEGDFSRPSYAQCRLALKEHMPELLPLWEHLLKISDGDDVTARLLSLYCPTPYLAGCSQAVWLRYNPVLVRNYDYDPKLCEGRILKSRWHDTTVIASTDCLWGVLDGMNEHGLSISLSFGGKEDVGEGFGIPLILRYILEFCKTTVEATEVLCRVPTHMAYNVTILDAHFHVNNVEVSPFMSPVVSQTPLAVNHQGDFELTNYAMFSRSHERKQVLIDKLYDPLMSVESFINAFEYDPLFVSNYGDGFGTLYTAVYNPSLRAMEYRWPYHLRHYLSFEHFEEQEFWVTY